MHTLDNLIEQLKNGFKLLVNDVSLEKCRAKLKEKAAERTLMKLENAAGWVIVEGSFGISVLDSYYYKFSYVHPISKYIAKSGEKVIISTIISKNLLEEHISVNYLQSVGNQIPLRIYGEVWQPINRKQKNLELQITPLAVY